MPSTAIRISSWLVLLASLVVFQIALRGTPSGPVSQINLLLLLVPFQIASISLLSLLWVGAFPESWPLIGGVGRFGRLLFWILSPLLLAFNVLMYTRFVF